MEVEELDEVLKVFESSLSRSKWRLKSSSKRRLETDTLALCTGMRGVVMVDYGGRMPELQERLCTFLKVAQKESTIFAPLRVMVIEDMIYLIHVGGLTEFVRSSLNCGTELHFVDLEQDPPKMLAQTENSSVVMQLISIQKKFSLVFPADGLNPSVSECHRMHSTDNAESSVGQLCSCGCSEFIDASSCIQDTEVTVPTLNGWLLGYPVVYLFGKAHISDAIYNLSTRSLHLFKVLVSRNVTSSKGSQEEELLSFSVPYDLSLEGKNEPWAEVFLAHIDARWEKCKHVWASLQMEVTACYSQAIVL